MSDGEILDAATTLLTPQLHNNYYEYLINSRMSDYNALQRLEEQLGSTQNSLSSLEGAHEEISMGARRNGRMSVVRRFFCLFVLFDLLLISLTWLLCIMLMGSDKIVEILKMQILHYNIHTSIFDIVLAAFCRFTVLLLFYGLLHLNTTFFVALTTVATCVFLICKVIYYSWDTASQPVFQVILVLMSFVIAWVEAWFLDFRVLPQELSALTYAQSTGRFSESLSTLLLDRNLRSPVMRHFLADMASQIAPTESNGNFYSPLESPNNSGDESDGEGPDKRKDQYVNLDPSYPGHSNRGAFGDRNQLRKKPIGDLRGSDINNEYLRRGKDTLEVAWSILNDSDWKLQETSADGDAVYSKYEAHLGRVFLLKLPVGLTKKLQGSLDPEDGCAVLLSVLKTTINISAQKLLEELFVNVDKFTTWNKTIVESRRVHVVDEHTDITYQVSAPGGNGVISSRDFVVLRHWNMKGDSFVLAGISIPYPGLQLNKKYVRGENGPCCWAMKSLGNEYNSCSFQFLLNTNLKGWIPQYVIESALTSVLLEYSACLKEHCKAITTKESS